jgi:hypothetical protein
VCPQLPNLDGFNLGTSNTEDWLYLNVFTQVIAGEANDYNASKLVTQGDVIVLTFNYRAVRSWSGFTAAALFAGTDMLITSPPSRLPATSNEVRVRVELSKNQLMIARPRKMLRFFSACRFNST